MKILKKIALATIVTVSSLSAHNLWVNSFESYMHKPGHTTVSLGWGHALPIDDITNPPHSKVILEEFSITDPKGERTALRIPSSKTAEVEIETKSFKVYNADLALQKIKLKKDSLEGVYKIEAKSKPTYYTVYIDKKDRQRFKLKSKEQLKDIKKVLVSFQYQALATSYLTLGKWEKPKATNKRLELIPKTDLSNVKVGDLIEVEVLFHGKPVESATKIEYLTANSASFGQSHDFSLFSMIKNGKAQFVVQSAGQWKIECLYENKVTKEGDLKELYGKVNSVINASSLTFNVK